MIIEEMPLTEEDFLDDACWRWDGDTVIPLQDGVNHFEQFSVPYQDKIADAIPQRNSWDLLVYRTKTCWAFDMDEYDVKSEALVGGTELALDYWYKKLSGCLPSEGDKMSLRVFIGDDSEGEYDTKLVWLNEAEFGMGNDYLDVYARMDCWLCPFLEALFKKVPEIIYLQIDPVVDFTGSL